MTDFEESDVTTPDDVKNSDILDALRKVYAQNEETHRLLQANQPKATDKMCNEHGVEMQSAISKKTNKPYAFHKSQDGQMCFGRGYQARLS